MDNQRERTLTRRDVLAREGQDPEIERQSYGEPIQEIFFSGLDDFK